MKQDSAVRLILLIGFFGGLLSVGLLYLLITLVVSFFGLDFTSLERSLAFLLLGVESNWRIAMFVLFVVGFLGGASLSLKLLRRYGAFPPTTMQRGINNFWAFICISFPGAVALGLSGYAAAILCSGSPSGVGSCRIRIVTTLGLLMALLAVGVGYLLAGWLNIIDDSAATE